MKLSSTVYGYLKGALFSNGLRVNIERGTRVNDRIAELERIATGKSVIHIGCVDHLPLIDEKLARGVWLHARLDQVTTNCLGIDTNAEGLEYISSGLGYKNVVEMDMLQDELPESLTSMRWDIAIMGEILEHVDNPVAFIESFRSKFGPQVNELVVTVPNAFKLRNFINSCKNVECINTDHRFWFTPYTLAKILTMGGSTVLDYQLCENSPVPRMSLFRRFILNQYPLLRHTIVMRVSLNNEPSM